MLEVNVYSFHTLYNKLQMTLEFLQNYHPKLLVCFWESSKLYQNFLPFFLHESKFQKWFIVEYYHLPNLMEGSWNLEPLYQPNIWEKIGLKINWKRITVVMKLKFKKLCSLRLWWNINEDVFLFMQFINILKWKLYLNWWSNVK